MAEAAVVGVPHDTGREPGLCHHPSARQVRNRRAERRVTQTQKEGKAGKTTCVRTKSTLYRLCPKLCRAR
ncbi:MAG: hypothetical protein R3C24_05150 [Cyanobacteriota/Melainabacteria group bacterium]